MTPECCGEEMTEVGHIKDQTVQAEALGCVWLKIICLYQCEKCKTIKME